jgi:hypothetical protein
LYKACERSTYGNWFRPRKLPSVSQFCRRVRQEVFQELLLAVHWELVGAGHDSPLKMIDGKPLLDQKDHRLLTPLKAQQRVKDGQHHPVTLRQMGPQRRQAVEAWESHEDLARYVLKDRVKIENLFSAITMALDAGSPPPWVRRLDRVRRWMGAIIILHNIRQDVREKMEKRKAA